MSDPDNFEQFVAGQFPFRPQGNPDFDVLVMVAQHVEELKEMGKTSREIQEWYDREIADAVSIAYMAVNRIIANKAEMSVTDRTFYTDVWTEGFMFGVLAERMRAIGRFARQIKK